MPEIIIWPWLIYQVVKPFPPGLWSITGTIPDGMNCLLIAHNQVDNNHHPFESQQNTQEDKRHEEIHRYQ